MSELTDVMATLRSPGGCLWDIEQNHKSLRKYIIEEVYEVIEAIDFSNKKEAKHGLLIIYLFIPLALLPYKAHKVGQ